MRITKPTGGGGKSLSQTPDDVLINILARLPSEELAGVRRVCRAWRALINLPWQFKNAPSRLLIQGLASGGADDRGIKKAHTTVYEWQRAAGVHRLIPPLAGNLDVVGAVNGILCLTEGHCDKFTLINPTTRSILRIPNPDPPELKVKIWSSGFGYDESRNTFLVLKIVFVSADEGYRNRPVCQAQRFDFPSGNWLNLSACRVQLMTKSGLGFGRAYELVVRGVPYWLGVDENGRYLVWFDATELEFKTEKLVWPDEDPVMTCDRSIAEIREGVIGGVAFQIFLNVDVYTRNGPEEWVKNYRILSVRPGRFLGFNLDSELLFQKEENREVEYIVSLKETGKVENFACLGRFEIAKKVIFFEPSLDRLPSIGKGGDKDKGGGDNEDSKRSRDKDGNDDDDSVPKRIGKGDDKDKRGGDNEDGKRNRDKDGKNDDDSVPKRTKYISMHV